MAVTNESLEQTASPKKSILNRVPPLVGDLLFVALFPAVCFALDPVLFGTGLDPTPLLGEAAQEATYCFVSLSIVLFFTTYLRTSSRFIQHLFAGWLLTGAAFAFALGLLLLPITLIGLTFIVGFLGLIPITLVGLTFIVGFLGLIPFGTARRYWLRFRKIGFGRPFQPTDFLSVFVASAMLIGPAALTYYHQRAQFDDLTSDLQSSDRKSIDDAMSKLGDGWLCRLYCQSKVSRMFADNKIKLTETEFTSQFKLSTGKDFKAIIDQLND